MLGLTEKDAKSLAGTIQPIAQQVVKISNIVIPSLKQTVELIKSVSSLISKASEIIGGLVNIVKTLMQIPGAITAIIKDALKLIKVFSEFAQILTGLGKSMFSLVLSPWGFAIIAMVALVYVLYKNWDSIVKYTKQAVQWVSDICSKGWDAIVKVAKSVWDSLSKFFSSFWEGTKKYSNLRYRL